MNDIRYHRIQKGDTALLQQIAQWYLKEWNMEPSTTISRLSGFPTVGIPFHLVMTVDEVAVATGGLALEVSLMKEVPHLKIYQPWLALVHTNPEHQNKGYGSLLCLKIEEMAKEMGINEYYLFTYTAEKLYTKLGWEIMKRIVVRGKDMVVMKKQVGISPNSSNKIHR